MSAKYHAYELDFPDHPKEALNIQDKIHSFQIHSEIKKSSSCHLSLTFSPREIQDLKLSQLPKHLQFNWGERTYFRGEATQIRVIGNNRVEIVYHDDLYKFKKIYSETQTKNQKLSFILNELLKDAKPQPELMFCSLKHFEDESPAFSVSHRTLDEIFTELSDFYGFTYFIRPDLSKTKSTLCFLRSGQSLTTHAITISLGSLLEPGQISHSPTLEYETVAVDLTDGVQKPLRQILGPDCLNKPLAQFKMNSEMKSGFKIKFPELAIPITQRDLYDRAREIFPYQHSQKNQLSDSKIFTLDEPKVQIGDLIQLTQPSANYQDQARYLVHATEITVESSRPKIKIVGMRP